MSHVRLAGAVSVLPRFPHHRKVNEADEDAQTPALIHINGNEKVIGTEKEVVVIASDKQEMSHIKDDYALNGMIPEPDYDGGSSPFQMRNKTVNYSNGPVIDEEGLVVPRKLTNPCTDSSERRDLHRELKFNNKVGKNVLNQKSELQKALEKHRELQSKKDTQQEKSTPRNTLEKVLEERARRLEQLERGPENDENVKTDSSSEFLRMHAKLRGRVEPMAIP